MKTDDQRGVAVISDLDEKKSQLVVRSTVPVRKNYSDYREFLRYDFFFSCAYCTIAESEAQAIRMTIDHYEPRNARPDLENTYDNLMYACDECNKRKGDRSPPPDARANGFRFMRSDQDFRDEHLECKGCGKFVIGLPNAKFLQAMACWLCENFILTNCHKKSKERRPEQSGMRHRPRARSLRK